MSLCRFGGKQYWDDYASMLKAFALEKGERPRKFVDRHYWNQFIREDEEGNR